MLPKVVGFVGFKGSGKSTAADILRDYLDYEVRALAAPLKEACQTIFRLSDDQVYTSEGKESLDPRWGMTPRKILQLFGTEVGRTFSTETWVKSLVYYIEENDVDRIAIDDVRFPNEARAINALGGAVIGIHRPEVVPELTWKDHVPRKIAKFLGLTQLHASEREMLDNWRSMVDLTIYNTRDLEFLKDRLIEEMEVLNGVYND